MTQTDNEDITSNSEKSIYIKQAVFYPDVKLTIKLFFVFLLNSFIVLIPASIISIALLHDLPSLRPILKVVLYMVPVLLTINYTLRKGKKLQHTPLQINFRKIQVWVIPLIFIGTLALIIPLSQASTLVPMPESVRKIFEKVFEKDIFSIVIAVIAAPILEEMLCRGIILEGLLKNYSPNKAILISAIFFAVIHLNPWQSIPAFLGGLYLGWVYYRTRSVIPGIIIHATINAIATLFLFLPNPQQDFSDRLGTHYFPIAFVTSVLLFFTICYILNKKTLIIPVLNGE